MGDRDQFLQLMARLRAVAERHGDAAFATALTDCIAEASGRARRCPMAELFWEDFAATGRAPRLDDPRTRPLRPMTPSDPPPYDRQRLLAYIHRALEERAILRNDSRYLEALHACQRATRESAECPMHRFLDREAPPPTP